MSENRGRRDTNFLIENFNELTPFTYMVFAFFIHFFLNILHNLLGKQNCLCKQSVFLESLVILHKTCVIEVD